MDTAIGKFYAPNISPHANGIAGWTNAQFLNAVMQGIDREGNNLYPVMPYTAYGGMKPEDVLDIKAYIETLIASDAVSKEHEIAFPYSRQTTITLWKRSHFNVADYQPREETQMERGRYLVENVGGCGVSVIRREPPLTVSTWKTPIPGKRALTGRGGARYFQGPDGRPCHTRRFHPRPDRRRQEALGRSPDRSRHARDRPWTVRSQREGPHRDLCLPVRPRGQAAAAGGAIGNGSLHGKHRRPPLLAAAMPALPARPMPSSANIAAIAMAPAKARKDPIRPVTSARSQPTPLSWFPAMPPNPVCLPR